MEEELHNMLFILESALDKILIAERTIDGRKRDKAIRVALEEAKNMVYPHKTRLIEICQMENIGDELFDLGHLKGDLQEVYGKLKEMKDSV